MDISKKTVIFSTVFLTVMLLLSVAAVLTQQFDTRKHAQEINSKVVKTEIPEYVPGEVLVKFKTVTAGEEPEVIKQMRKKRSIQKLQLEPIFSAVKSKEQELTVHATSTLNTQEIDKIAEQKKELSKIYKLTFDENLDISELVSELEEDPSVEYAEPNYIYTTQVTPNDPYFSDQWGLHNTGQTGGTADADIDAPEAWDISTRSEDVIVAVIDTGIDYNHPDLADNIWTNPDEIPGNNIDDDNNGYVDDINGWNFAYNNNDPMDDVGHGTHVAGIIGAVGNNNIGITGIAWKTSMMALKFLNSDGSGYADDAARAILYASNNGAKITNNSWGGGPFSNTLRDAIQFSQELNVFFVAAAGNSTSNIDRIPSYPASYNIDNIISVAATDKNDSFAYFSNSGLTTVDLTAPGVDILSTLPNNGYGKKNGTSMAAPHVTGALALLLSKSPNYSLLKLKDILFGMTDKTLEISEKVLSGGRLNLNNLLTPREFSFYPGSILFYTNRDTSKTREIKFLNYGSNSIQWNVTSTLPSWISLSKSSGAVQRETSDSLVVTINPTELESKTYTYTLELSSNAPNYQKIEIPISVSIYSSYSPRWAKAFETSDWSHIVGLQSDGEGNIILAGNFAGSIKLGTQTLSSANKNDTDAFIGKVSSSGEFLWTIHVENTASLGSQDIKKIFTDKNKNTYITGLYSGSMKIQDKSLDNNSVGPYRYVAKLSNSGQVQWLRQVSSESIGYKSWGLAGDKDGNYYISAELDGTSKLLKFDSTGNKIWEKIDEISDIAIDKDNNIFTTGLIPYIKIDKDGNELKRYQGEEELGYGNSIVIGKSGSVYVAGSYLRIYAPIITPSTARDVRVLGFDSEGNLKWKKSVYGCQTAGCMGENYGDFISADDEENIYVSGRVAGDVYIENEKYPLGVSKPLDILILKLNPTGRVLYADFVGNSSYEDKTGGIVTDSQNVYLAGSFRSYIKFGRLFVGGINDYSGFLARLKLNKAFPVFPTPISSGKALKIDNNTGTKSFAKIKDEDKKIVIGKQSTIEFWIKTPSSFGPDNAQTILFRQGTGSIYPNLDIQYKPIYKAGTYKIDSARLIFGTGSNSFQLDDKRIPLNTWVHVAFTRDGKKITYYLNGEWIQEFDLPSDEIIPTSPTNNFYLGGQIFDTYTNLLVTADIDDLRISSEVRDVEKLWMENAYFSTLPTDVSTIGYWQFNDSIESDGQYKFPGTLVGNATYIQGIVAKTPTSTPSPSGQTYLEGPARSKAGANGTCTPRFVAKWRNSPYKELNMVNNGVASIICADGALNPCNISMIFPGSSYDSKAQPAEGTQTRFMIYGGLTDQSKKLLATSENFTCY